MWFSKFNVSWIHAGLIAMAFSGIAANAIAETVHDTDNSARAVSEVSSAEDGTIAADSRIAPADRHGRQMHFIRFGEQSLARYDGHLEGLPATSPRVTGRPIDLNSRAATDYVDFLRDRHQDYLSDISRHLSRRAEPSFQYLNVLNAVAMPLTPQEASLIRGLPFVVDVVVERIETLDTDAGPQLIGAPEFWDGDTITGLGNKGEGVIIGIIDSGFNHSHPSFAEEASDGHVHTNPLGDGVFLGVCAAGVDICNNKLIGSYNFHPDDSAGSEDTNSHGTHVASTAGGNPVEANFQGLTVPITGVAPRANLVNYKVCEPGCPQSSSVAAVNRAIEDGVDILNYSISGSDDPWNNIVDLAFLDANAAGIFVAASAGNDGPGASTVAKTGPWNSAVGNSTHGRIFAQTVSLAGLADVAGVPGTGPELQNVFSGQLRYAGDVEAANFEGCNAFPANAFDGEAALISRGGCPFADKVNNAVAAGAGFVVVFNSQGGPPISMGGLDGTTVPSLMITDSDGADFIAQLDGSTGSLTVDPEIGRFEDSAQFADIMATGSSRGPSQFNLLSPTVTAPGTSILAAATDDRGQFIAIGGTSMASPHMAGSAALLIGQDQGLTPTEVRSAIALTASPTTRKQDGETPSDAFDQGSGRIDVRAAGNVGFVMDESIANFEAADPAEGGQPETLNLPSYQNWRCPDVCSFERTLRSTAANAIGYVVTVEEPAGMTITVSPPAFTLDPLDSQTIEVSVDVTGMELDKWQFGALNIVQAPLESAPGTQAEAPDGVSPARMPIAVVPALNQPVLEIAPLGLSATQQRDEITAQTFQIANAGELPLEWSLAELGPEGNGGPFVGPGELWSNPRSGTSGRINNFSIPDDTGIYQSDAFALLVPSRIETIFSEGFTLGTPGVTELSWMIFEDDNGVPAGDPETNPEDAVWSFTAPINAPGVSFADADMSLDLAAAGAPELELDPGVYWLVAYPTAELYSLGPNNLHAWFHGAGGTGRQIGPGGLSGFPTSWVGVPEGRAFRLTGSVQCESRFNPWTNVTPTSGTVDIDDAIEVTVEFYSTGLLEGTYNSTLCITSNDPEAGFVLFPVTLNVVNLPDASVSPDQVSLSADFGNSDTAEVTLRNDGLGELEFEIFAAGSPPAAATVLLFDNGPVITSEGTGPNGADSSLLQNSSLEMTTLGAAVNPSGSGPQFRMADDFTISGGATQIDQLRLFAYQTGSDTTSTFDTVNYRIWDGPPDDPASNVVYGDTTTNRFVDTGWTGAYRYSETSVGTARPVMYIDAEAGVTLGVGTYWVDWQLDGTLTSGPWQPPVTIIGQTVTGDALQLTGDGWGGFTDGGTDTAQGAPFQLFGSDVLCDRLDEVVWLSASPGAGVVGPEGGEQVVTLTADASMALPGSHVATICFETNDDANPLLPIDVTLTVTGEAPDDIFQDRFEGSNDD